ncbi:MAG: helix-turn-helix transcriptional regulator [Proteobacteria bacterium]|nr:helix-turn-helix transcriptional regulator [Pseudomonadota bacterium]
MGKHEEWLSVADDFAAAALDDGIWLTALSRLAALTGFRCGQLIGVGSSAAVPFNFMNDIDPAAIEEFAAIGGADPAFNPRIRAGLRSPLMKSLAEADFVTREEFEHGAYYNDYCRRHDLQFGCVMPMLRDADSMIGLAVFRGLAQGHITADERQVFDSLAPHVRSAVRTRIALEKQGALVLKGALDALAITAFICDRAGTVRTMTCSAEDALHQGTLLRLHDGRLRALQTADSRKLAEAVDKAALGPQSSNGSALATAIVVRGCDSLPVVLDVIPLPQRDYSFGFDPRVLVVLRGSNSDGDSARTLALLQTAYQLTPAEAQIAMQIAAGHAPDTIARNRSVSVSTVRVQMRSVFAKLGVRRQSELVARLNRFR